MSVLLCGSLSADGVCITCRAYYYGDKTPREDPEYYVCLVQSLYEHFLSSVQTSDHSMPLVINTCGWLKGGCDTSGLEWV